MRPHIGLSMIAIGSLSLAGCQKPAPSIQLPIVAYDASAAGDGAIAAYDTDQDGLLSAEELKGCPGIAANISRYDADGDAYVSADEIYARVRRWEKLGGAFLPYRCLVLLDGKPLPGANVELKLEEFLGTSPPATGQSAFDGVTAVSIATESIPEQLRSTPLVPAGLYKVIITHQNRKLPPRYNTATELGCEVSPDTADPSKVNTFQLKAN